MGRDWGLDPADVDDLVRYRLEDNAARGRREKMWNVGVICGAIGAAVLVVLILVVLAVRNWSGVRNPEAKATDPDAASPDVTTEPRRTKPPAVFHGSLFYRE